MNQILWILTLALLNMICESKLVVQSPPQLKTKLQQKYPQGIHYSVANYGDVPFGKSLGGTIYLSSHLQNCQFEPLDTEAQRTINKIVLSTRGDCTFTTKSLNAQKQGAKLAIIADSDQSQDPGSIIMVDDGKGPQVTIPTILISHEAGKLITDSILLNKAKVTLVINFETFKKPVADVTLWMSSYDRKSYVLVRQLQPYLKRIPESIKLSVYHPTSACSTCPETDCYNNKGYCINTGFYGYTITGYGQEVIKQQLKQQIVMQKYPSLWWQYVQQYDQQCDDRQSIAECSDQSLKTVGIDPQIINKQVESSFTNRTFRDFITGENKTTLDNKILQANDQNRYRSGILLFPGVVVNNITYRGNLDALQVFQMICQSLLEQPPGCSFQVKVNKQNPWKYIIIVTFVFVFFMIFLLLCYRRHVRREITRNLNNQVSELVNQYITMYQQQRFDCADSTPGSSTQTNHK